MNCQILLESYAAGQCINKEKLSLLELGLDFQLEFINFFIALKIAQKSTKTHFEAV